MAKKKKTLPKNITDILTTKDLEAFKVVFDECEWSAYERGDWMKKPLICFYNIPAQFIRYMVENGADIEAKDTYGRSALWHHASVYASEGVAVLLELGADVHTTDYQGDTPLHAAAHRLETVQLLLEYGANPKAKNHQSETPLEKLLKTLANRDVADAASVAALYLQWDIKVDQTHKKAVQQIAEQFDFYKDSFNPNTLDKTVASLEKLCQLFNVAPITPRIKHDGIANITLPDGDWQSDVGIFSVRVRQGNDRSGRTHSHCRENS